LIEVFTHNSWASLKDKNSTIYKILTADIFKFKGDMGSADVRDPIDLAALNSFGMFHCQDESGRDKSKVLYQLIQDGGIMAHDFIDVDDKDLKISFELLCKLSTIEIFKFYQEFGGGSIEMSKEDLEKVCSEETIDAVFETFANELFGSGNKLESDEWIELLMSEQHRWVYDSESLRKALFKEADINYSFN
jgi:hypothetical protein